MIVQVKSLKSVKNCFRDNSCSYAIVNINIENDNEEGEKVAFSRRS